tara:strand:+ start:42556 stop:43503 length:948 start_codon:yes stop_codon:yes gene_type:complete
VNDNRILIIGSEGQLGIELCEALQKYYPDKNIIRADIRSSTHLSNISFEYLDVTDVDAIRALIDKHQITEVYLLAALLSASAEKNIKQAWKVNIQGLLNLLELGREGVIRKLFWPSSIAVFGYESQRQQCPQNGIHKPITVYGISKLSGEHWCQYYHQKYNFDVRSIRYPGLISFKSQPGGGTTDYVMDMFRSASSGTFMSCSINPEKALPMLYISDAVEATIQLMHAESSKITIRDSYNIGGMSFSPNELALALKRKYPNFIPEYQRDFRYDIAESWPDSLSYKQASYDWNYQSKIDFEKMMSIMTNNMRVIAN